MLYLFANKVNISKIAKILAKFNIKASITDSAIIINGTVSEDLARELYTNATIIAFSNFNDANPIFSTQNLTKVEDKDIVSEKNLVRYSKVKRGEVYLCDFGPNTEHLQCGKRYAIIIQNNTGNEFSPNTIVIPCTSQPKQDMPVHYTFKFSPENLKDFRNAKVSRKTNTLLGEAITTVSKSSLIDYLGTMTECFMDQKVQPLINRSLDLKNPTEIVKLPEMEKVVKTKTVYVDRASEVTSSNIPVYKDLNLAQIKLLTLIDINDFISLSKLNINDFEKAHRAMLLFGFDFSRNGVQYVLDAICIAPKSTYYTLPTLTQKLSDTGEYDIPASEIMRIIIARIKENFHSKHSPTIEFIRLISSLLIKREDN